jgi:MoaA/NifB/PqqE/SkfB family radical SAM enzyme
MTCSASIKEPKKGKYRFTMSRSGLIAYDKEGLTTIRFNEEETSELLNRKVNLSKYDHFCEVAHLEISNTCNMQCEYCYVDNKNGIELPTKDWEYIIDNLASSGVFQVSFGGGEPTLRKDLFKLAKHVYDTGMNLGMTTNGGILTTLDPVLLHKYFQQINVSWHGSPDIFEEALEFLKEAGIPRGINYCYSKQLARDKDMVKFCAKEYDAELLYLVYKPVIKDTRNQISSHEVYMAAKEAANEGLKVAVDGPCVNQCLMKRKFVDVDHLGNVYPCSFVRKPLGNLLKKDFKEVWKNRGEQDECPFVKFRKEEK